MKKLLLTAAAVITALNIYAQGTPYGIVNFSNLGRPAEDRVTVYVGQVVEAPAGTAYMVALYWGPARSTTDANFFQAGAAVGFAASGQFGGGNRTITPLAVNGDTVSIQVRGWETRLGARTYEEALVQFSQVGKSIWFDLKTKDPTDTLPPPTLGQQAAWTGFLIGIPEPSVIALGLLGGIALLLRRCRR